MTHRWNSCHDGIATYQELANPCTATPDDRTRFVVPDPRETPVLDVAAAGELLGLGRSKSYEEANRYLDTEGTEGLPAYRFGRRIVCPTALVLQVLGLASTISLMSQHEVIDR
ncbi:MAG: hypothetical protein GY788_01580 [bacterium]|nr:hypothetical protein [bacterium]